MRGIEEEENIYGSENQLERMPANQQNKCGKQSHTGVKNTRRRPRKTWNDDSKE